MPSLQWAAMQLFPNRLEPTARLTYTDEQIFELTINDNKCWWARLES